jgi:DNA-binding transcriptional regulator YhcF (GntR family)
VRLPHWIIETVAYRALKPLARAILIELIKRYNGYNNGAIGLGHREAAHACNVSKNTIKPGFDELLEKGFIRVSRPGGFNMKDPSTRRASEWRLTWLEVGNEKPTYEFKEWLGADRGP